MDLDLRGAGASVSGGFAFSGGGGSPQTRSLVLRVNARDFRSAYFVGWNSVDHDENFIFDSNFTNLGSNVGPGGSNAVYFGGKRSAVMGTSVAGVTGSAEHILRIWHTRRMVISDNILMDPAGTKHVIKLHNERELYGLVATSPPFPPNGQFVIISNNIFRSSDNSIINVGPQNNDVGIDEFIRDVIIERNSFLARTTSQDTTRDIQIRAYNVTVRNNVFNGQGAFGDYAAVHVFTGANQPGASIGTSVYDNSIYHGGSITQFAGIQVVGGSQLTIVRNNIAYAPSGVIKTVLDNGASGTVSSNNVLASSNPFVSPPNNLRLLTGNSAINTGASVPVFDDYDLKSRPIGSGWDIGAFENGTVAPIVSLINASLSASRTSCVAPCAVFFDATATNASTTSRPFHELDYSWDFGDSSSGVWTLSGKNKNSAKGPMGAHVFETPGIYTITLNVKDLAGNTASKQVSVTITDPNVAFTEANTFCFAKDNLNWAGCPTTIATNRIVSNDASLVSNLNSRFAANRRLMLRRGDSWNVGAQIFINVNGPGILGAFGSGNKPQISTSQDGLAGLIFAEGDDWRITDLYLVGPSSSSGTYTELGIVSDGDNNLILRNNITRFYWLGFTTNLPYYTASGAILVPPSDGTAWIENNVYDVGIYTGYPAGNRMSIIGNNLGPARYSHVLRMWQANKVLIENNFIADPSTDNGNGRHALKFLSVNGSYTQYALISDNVFRGSAEVVHLTPENTISDERLMDIIFERNKIVTGTNAFTPTTNFLIVSGRNITIRNNIFEATKDFFRAIKIETTCPCVPPSADVSVYDNTFYTSSLVNGFYGVQVGGDATNTVIRNNLGYALNFMNNGEETIFVENNAGSQTQMSNNLFYSTVKPSACVNPSGGSTCIDPLLVNPSGGNYRLQSNSPAINTGTTVPVLDDYDGKSRPIGSGWDIGAFENGTGGATGEFCGNGICSAGAGETCSTCSIDCGPCVDTGPPSAPSALIVSGVAFTQINLSWGASSDDSGVVAGYRIYRNNTIVGTSGGTTYSDNGLLSGAQYRYNVTAFDALGKNSTSSNSILQTTSTDTTAPGIVSVTALTNTSVQVIFNEMVNRTTAQNTVNYAINGSIVVNSAVLNVDNVTLTLGTSQHNPWNYRLTVSGVKDIVGNTMGSVEINYLVSSASEGLVALWSFDEGAGTTAVDSSGNSNNGILNGPTWTTGKLDGGLSFDGVNDRIDIANSASLNIAGSSISISLWVNPQPLTASTDSVIIAKFWDPTKNPALPYQYGVELTAGNRPTFYFGNGVTFNRADMTPTIPYGQWSYITVTYDGGNVRWYRDGIAVSVTPLVSSLQARGQAMKMGVDQDNTQPNKGVIDELRIYNKVLSQGEVSALFALINESSGSGGGYNFHFEDNFNDGAADGWFERNYTPTPEGNGLWNVAVDAVGGSQAYQVSGTFDNADIPFRLGEYSLIDGYIFSDFQITGKIRTTNNDRVDRDLTIVFGYKNDTNYYSAVFANSNPGYTNGLFVVEGGNDVARIGTSPSQVSLINNQYANFRLVKAGNDISMYVNNGAGEFLLASATDSSFANGMIGLGTFADTGFFDDIVLDAVLVNSKPDINSFYQYPTSLSSGRVYSFCNISDAQTASSSLNVNQMYRLPAGSWNAFSSSFLGKKVIQTIGDSITAGWDTHDPSPSRFAGSDPVDHQYQYWLDQYLNSNVSVLNGSGYEIYNHGYGGQTCDGLIQSNFAGDTNGANYAIILCGTNSIDQWQTSSQAAVQTMVNSALSRGIVPILMTIPPMDYPEGQRHCSAVDAYNNWLSSYAQTNNIILVDLHSLFDNGENCVAGTLTGLNTSLIDNDSAGWVHPSVEGHKVIARAIWEQAFHKGVFGGFIGNTTLASGTYDFMCSVSDGTFSDSNTNLASVVVGGSVCGDSSLDVGEECDDGNMVNGDGCTSQCKLYSKFAVIGDYGTAGANELAVANLVKGWSPNFIITTGDNNYPNGAAGTIDNNIGQYYHDYIYSYTGSFGFGSSTRRFLPSLGNHDWNTAGAVPYLNYFTLFGNERYYDYVIGNMHFFVVDSDPNEVDGTSSASVQGQWLQNALASSTSLFNIVYFHHPPFSSGTTHGSTANMQWPFQSWGADVVLSGHEHNYERILKSGFPYFVNGLGGTSLYAFSATPVSGSVSRYNSNYGAMLVETNKTVMNFTFINILGQVIDSYVLTDVSGQVCGDNICSAGEDCSADAVAGCVDNSCFEPTCTNGCGQVAVSNGGTDEACVAPSSCNGAGVCVGTFTLNTSVIVGAGGAAGEVSLLGATNKSVVFNFSVNGNVGNLVDSTADAKFFKNGVNRTNSTCILAETGANKRVYECTIKMPFYDEAGVWNISVNISDDAGLTKTDNSGTFSVNILRDVTPSAFAVNFPIIVPGAVDVPANAMPLNLTNTGNFNDTISIQAYNLHGVSTPSQFIDASNFRAGLTASVCSTGVFLANNTVTLVPLSNLPVGANSKEGFYYCLKIVPSISSQLYSTLPGFGWKIGFF